MTELYYEAHVTIEPVDRVLDLKRVQYIAADHGFKVADLYMVKPRAETPERSNRDTFMTAHSKNLADIKHRTRTLILELQSHGFTVWRYKVEDTILDSRHQDVLNLLAKRRDSVLYSDTRTTGL